VQEEEAAMRDLAHLEQEKKCLIREMKRIHDEDASPFNHFPILNKRYALLNLLGKGGFSEVYKVKHFLQCLVFFDAKNETKLMLTKASCSLN
jgi:serine/threonine protein kinase